MTVLINNYYSPSLAVVVAAYNEEEGITPTLSELNDVLNESYLIVVDGKSTDRTVEFAKDLGAEVIIQNGKGKGDAISQGLNQLPDTVQYVVLTDADYTYPAIHLKGMIEILKNNPTVGMVLGNRFSKKFSEKSDRNQFYLGNRLLGFTQWLFNGVNLSDPYSGLRVIRFNLLKDWKPKSKGFDIEAELNYYVTKLGYKIVEMPIIYRKRLGAKKLCFKHGLNILRRIVLEKISSEKNN